MEQIIKKCLPTYDVEAKIGEGIYGKVYRIKDSLKTRAVKVVPLIVERSLSFNSTTDLDEKISADFYAIREYYETIKGQGVLEIYDFHLVNKTITDQNAKGYLVVLMAYYPENLADHVLNRFPLRPDAAVSLITDLAKVLDRLFANEIDSYLITDLKPANLLIDTTKHLLIGDLGGVKRINSISTAGLAQFTPNWSAPEIVLGGSKPSLASAIFSFGLVSFFIFEGRLPYESIGFLERLNTLKESGADFSRRDTPAMVIRLIRQCLDNNVANRPMDFMQILNALQAGAGDRTSADGTVEIQKNQDADLDSNQSRRSPPFPDGFQRPVGGTAPAPWIEPLTGMVFVWVQGGVFHMGCGEWCGEGYDNEYPAHKVILSGFWIGKHPVTQGQWSSVMNTDPSCFKADQNRPVEQVSWVDALSFVEMLSKASPGDRRFQLPTEAQWEYAARSRGKPHIYAGGADIDMYGWYFHNTRESTCAVGGKKPNDLGIHDMSGNVWEWCSDAYHQEAYQLHGLKNPTMIDNEALKVRRGGCWFSQSSGCRTTHRGKGLQTDCANYIGFRVVITAPG